MLYAVVDQGVWRWQHIGPDGDSWCEPEKSWCLLWKEQFESSSRDISIVDSETRKRHRDDVLCGSDLPRPTVLKLQHSPISEKERDAREDFFRRTHRMFWLVHLHDENSFLAFNFGISLNYDDMREIDGKRFMVINWFGRSKHFIEKWKRAKAHVFFDWNDRIYYLAGERVALRLGGPLKKGNLHFAASRTMNSYARCMGKAKQTCR